MKTKILLIILGMVLLLGGVIGGGLLTKQIGLSKIIYDTLAEKGVSQIEKGKVICDDKYCKVHLYQYNIINTDVQTPIQRWDENGYCEQVEVPCKIKQTENGGVELGGGVIIPPKICYKEQCRGAWIDKTQEEILADLDIVVSDRLNDVANYFNKDKNKLPENVIENEGVIQIQSK